LPLFAAQALAALLEQELAEQRVERVDRLVADPAASVKRCRRYT
jgi:hypothetical protein